MVSEEENVLINKCELEKIKEEAAAAKEELSSYREKTEKLQQELTVRTRLFRIVFRANNYTGLTVQICMIWGFFNLVLRMPLRKTVIQYLLSVE